MKRKNRKTIKDIIIKVAKHYVGYVVLKRILLNDIYAELKKIHRKPYDETISREFRRLKQLGIIDYEVISNKYSIYEINAVNERGDK